MVEQGAVAYETQFDRKAYMSAETADRGKLDAYTKRQIETHLGERFNVLLSTTRYEIRDGQIFGEETYEPFINVLTRGRNYRRLHGSPLDYAREDAEVLGFAKTEQALLGRDVLPGTMMLSVSPPGIEGSIYKHNFYDIFTLKEDQKGKFIEARRYSSGLSIEETTAKLKAIGVLAPDANPTAEQFLGNPIIIEPQRSLLQSADDIHGYLHKEHRYTKKQEFDQAWKMMGFLVTSYIKSLADNPFDANDHNIHFNAILNGYDRAIDIVGRKGNVDFKDVYAVNRMLNSQSHIFMLGSQPVRAVDTGCGFSAGALTNSPFSVAEYGNLPNGKSNEKTILCCTCPFCRKEVEAEIEGGKITCPKCNNSVPFVQEQTKYLM